MHLSEETMNRATEVSHFFINCCITHFLADKILAAKENSQFDLRLELCNCRFEFTVNDNTPSEFPEYPWSHKTDRNTNLDPLNPSCNSWPGTGQWGDHH